MPGIANICSITSDPVKSAAAVGPRVAATGIEAGLRQCRNRVSRRPRPLARAVRAKSSWPVSKRPLLNRRATCAAGARARQITGRTKDKGCVQPAGGKTGKRKANARIKSPAMTYKGSEIPNDAKTVIARSGQRPCCQAARMPKKSPRPTPKISAKVPNKKEAGIPAPRIVETS